MWAQLGVSDDRRTSLASIGYALSQIMATQKTLSLFDGRWQMSYEHNAPSVDENGQGCWNVWVDNAVLPETFHSHAEALTFAERKDAESHKVFTDFD